jgi:hypothetical protein
MNLAQQQDDKLYKHQMLDTSYQFVPDVTDSDRYNLTSIWTVNHTSS